MGGFMDGLLRLENCGNGETRMAKQRIKRFFIGIGLALFLVVIGYILIRPIHQRWGATNLEADASMQGDLNGMQWTRATTINVPPEQVWPWIVQFGQGRGGWYSYDWLENLMGFDIHTAEQILPEFQEVEIGEPICMAKGNCISNVSLIEPYQWFGWAAADEAGNPVWTFTFKLTPIENTGTRLVVRESFDQKAMPPAVVTIIEVPDIVMGQKMLQTLKDRAEGSTSSLWTTVFEIGAWLTAFGLFWAAMVLFMNRKNWQIPLALVAASAVILLALTFLFPPLWIRALMDAVLLLLVVYEYRTYS